MASTNRRSSHPVHPWRPLLALFVAIAAMVGGMAASGSWVPKLGLDLRGGTTITLTASNSTGGGQVDKASLEQARTILQQRVDSLGVGESEVTTANNNQITVSVPNVSQDRLRDMVGQTALLNFRVVYYAEPIAVPAATPSPGATPQAGSGSTAPQASVVPQASTTPKANNLPTAPAAPAKPSVAPSPYPSVAGKGVPQDKALTWQPDQQAVANFAAYHCGDPVNDVADQPLMTCDREGTAKYLLGPTVVSGQQVQTASAGIPQGQLQWVVTMDFNSEGARLFADATAQLAQGVPTKQFAIVLDGRVVSAPQVNEVIPNGRAQIDGGSQGFTQESAQSLASVLKYGALPLALTIDSVDTVSPVLGGEQLRGALIAGLLGLILVAAFAVAMYRTLSWIVIATIALAAVMTYSLMVLLGQGLGVATNLPGVAGAIVGIGVTADSFIIFFERIKDEVRSGRTIRSAVESGWEKARGTILISDGVQLLSALVLFILSIGAVRGFAFILGLATIIDLVVTFLFTKPVMTLLMRTRYFGEGRRGSGLEPASIGVERLPTSRRRPRDAAPATSRVATSSPVASAPVASAPVTNSVPTTEEA
ncbi:preprotein translocase subunit SecD [Raineyella antarctica]|uniref:Protein translocase subunit SecD n=1 Tax=Raineyella antarctica TaxID=1577474 RepID=A0A1G6GT55_9ACTN|nr:protein translocase subunit SecD [Raineyella antarctica]SDB85119.1 preprotein translocase subunit SecD [Raineyella antarctica]